MSNFNEKLQTLLKTDSRFVDQEGDLLRNEVIDKAFKIDEKIIELLISDDEVKSKFFCEIKEHWVFNINTFVDFIQDKNFLNDSYTKYKNKIGLNIGGRFLSERKELELVRPYKDCIIEGGQSKEEQKRKEIFFNETLAQDEIDMLLNPKVLTNWQKYTKDGEQKVEGFTKNKDGTIKDNLIIKGNNLLALHTLKKEFTGKVKLIYIDPPYNTGNDGFKYNDNFNHSTWLTFMKNRLEVARELLKNDGLIFVQCDDNEQAYLKILMDNIFGRGNSDYMTWQKTDPRYDQNTNSKVINRFKRIHEHILIGYKSDKNNYKFNKIYRLPEWSKKQPNPDKDIRGGWQSGIVSFEENHEKEDKKSEYYYSITLPSGRKMTRHFFVKEKEFENLLKDNRIYFPKNGDGVPRLKIFENEEKDYYCDSIIRGFGTSSTAKKELEELGFDLGEFDTPKPEKLIAEIIRMTTIENDLVLDFFGGSGTTGAVAHKMNRQYILIEQMDYIHDLPEARLKKVVKGEQGGISKSVNRQGGGEFIYCELKKYNQDFIDHIQEAKDTKELLKIWENMKSKSFLNYNVDITKQDEAIEEFKQLSLDQQKQALVELLDKNQLYVNLSEINDKNFKVSDEDKKLNDLFYSL